MTQKEAIRLLEIVTDVNEQYSKEERMKAAARLEELFRFAYFGDTHPGISVISTQFVSYKMAFVCKFIISFLNSHLLSQNDAKSVQFCPGSHQQ